MIEYNMSNDVSKFISMYKKRVLYISYDGLTDPLGQSQVLPYLNSLSKLNYEITVLSAEKNEIFLKNKTIIENICFENNIKWENIIYTKTPPVLSTVKDVRALLRKAKSIYKENNFEIVHCRSYISALIGLTLKDRFGVKFIFDMRGFWADERIDGGIWNLRIPLFRWVYSFFKKKEKAFLLNADAIVSLTYNGKNEIMSWNGMNHLEEMISVIPCCADLNHFNFSESGIEIGVKESLDIPSSHKVLCYLGSIGTWYMMEEMLDYFVVHTDRYPETTFLWITKDNPESILNAARERGIEDKILIKGSERKDLPSLLSICDASLFFIKPLFSKKASSPTKMAELLGMGIPIICNTNVGDTDGIVKKENVGIVLNNFSNDEYEQAVDGFESLLETPKSHLRDVAKKYFSLSGGVESYKSIYDRLSK